jgi:lysozyme family protein
MAYELYKLGWWDKMHLDVVATYSMALAHRLFDFGVNAGRGRAITALQRILNVSNKQGTLWPDIVVDGSMGPGTLNALHAYVAVNKNNPGAVEKLTMFMFSAQSWHYLELTEKAPTQEEFFNGWGNRVWADWYQYAKWLTP